MELERMQCGLIDVKAVGDEDEMTFSGYGAVFGNIDAYGDMIQPGAFKGSISEAKKSGIWPAMLEQHGGWGMSASDLTPIGVWTEMREDEKGLALEGKFAPTTRGREMYTLLKMTPRPALNGLSIGYRVKEFSLGTKPEEPRRTLKKIDLYEISPVTFPANTKARVHDVKTIEQLGSLPDIEAFLRDACGLSRGAVKTLIARIKGDSLREAGGVPELDQLAAALKANTATLRAIARR